MVTRADVLIPNNGLQPRPPKDSAASCSAATVSPHYMQPILSDRSQRTLHVPPARALSGRLQQIHGRTTADNSFVWLSRIDQAAWIPSGHGQQPRVHGSAKVCFRAREDSRCSLASSLPRSKSGSDFSQEIGRAHV